MGEIVSIRTKFGISIGVILMFFMLAVTFYHFEVARHILKDRVFQHELRLLIENHALKVENRIDTAIDISSSMANNTFLKEWLMQEIGNEQKIAEYLMGIKKAYGASTAFLVSESTLSVYSEKGFSKVLEPENPHDNWYEEIKLYGGNYFIDPGLDQDHKILSLFVDYKVKNSKGDLLGVTGVGLRLNGVIDMVEDFVIGQQGRIFFADREGKILLHKDRKLIEEGTLKSYPSTREIAREILKNRNGTYIHEIDNRGMMVASYYIKEMGWHMVLELSKEELLNDIYDGLIYNLLVGVLVTLLLIYFVTRAFSMTMVKPILTLRDAVMNVKERNFKAYVDLDRDDEIGELAHSFNDMTITINGYIHEKVARLTTDELTGLPNRNKLLDDLKKHACPVVAILDIDLFAQVNNLYGHEIGDKVLLRMRDLIQSLITTEEFSLYKLENDEFGILANHTRENLEGLQQVFHDLQKILDSVPFECSGYSIYITSTMGLAVDREDITKYAKMALRKAKDRKEGFLVYSDELKIVEEYQSNLKWLSALKVSFLEDGIINAYQPIRNNHTGKIEKYETLVRMRTEDGEIVSPFFFLDIAKRAKAYSEITRRVVSQAFEHFKTGEEEFSINLSVEDIVSEPTVQFLKQKLSEFPHPERVVLEIVESEGIENYDQVSFFIDEMRGYGCKVAIDDFGTGYSNFEYLLKLNIDYIKIDGSLIKNIDKDRNSRVVVEVVVEFAKRFEIKTIAEFVHSPVIQQIVEEIGIDYSQGYFIGKPEVE